MRYKAIEIIEEEGQFHFKMKDKKGYEHEFRASSLDVAEEIIRYQMKYYPDLRNEYYEKND